MSSVSSEEKNFQNKNTKTFKINSNKFKLPHPLTLQIRDLNAQLRWSIFSLEILKRTKYKSLRNLKPKLEILLSPLLRFSHWQWALISKKEMTKKNQKLKKYSLQQSSSSKTMMLPWTVSKSLERLSLTEERLKLSWISTISKTTPFSRFIPQAFKKRMRIWLRNSSKINYWNPIDRWTRMSFRSTFSQLSLIKLGSAESILDPNKMEKISLWIMSLSERPSWRTTKARTISASTLMLILKH